MLRTLPQARTWTELHRLGAALAFTGITIIAARISIPLEPVPFTLQPLAVLLAGLVLGARDGALSQLLYVLLIAAGLPLDARALGTAALFGPTGGYLIGFIAAAFVTGWIAERARGALLLRFLAGVAGIAVLYACGVLMLMQYLNIGIEQAWATGAAPFLLPDLAKALIAAALAEGGRAALMRFGLWR